MKKRFGMGLTVLALVGSFGIGAATSSPTAFAAMVGLGQGMSGEVYAGETTAVSMLQEAQLAVARSKAELAQAEGFLSKAISSINSGNTTVPAPVSAPRQDPEDRCCEDD